MKRALLARAAIALVCLLLILFMFGPKPRLDPNRLFAPRPWPTQLSSLEEALLSREPESVTEGAQARIVWHEGVKRSRIAVLFVHGFSATRQELAPLPEKVAKTLHANLVEARLTGHGLSGEDLARANVEAWLQEVVEFFDLAALMGEKVVVLASSTGCPLVTSAFFSPNLKAISNPAREPAALVFLSPNFGLASGSAQLLDLPWSTTWLPWLVSSRSWTPQNEEQARYWTHSYPIEALFAMVAAMAAGRAASAESAKTPLFILYHPNDPVVSIGAMQTMFARWGTAKKRIEPVSGPGDTHVLAGAIVSPERTEPLKDAISVWLSEQVGLQ